MSWGMTWDEFWNGSLDRLGDYWQANQFSIERRNQELWLLGMYMQAAIASTLNKKAKYPEKPYRITEMTDEEKEVENKRKVEQFREILNARKRRWEAKQRNDAV